MIINKDQLADWLNNKKPVTLLDIRPKNEREEWSVPGSIHADVYDKLKNNAPIAWDEVKLDHRHPVVTICAAGKSSIAAARQLRQLGFDAYSLEGGMKAWNFAWNMAEIIFDTVKIIQVRRSSKGCLSYIVGSNQEAIVIDAALDPAVYIELATANGWTIRYVTDTHIHADYLSRTRELAKLTNAELLLGEKSEVSYLFSPLKDGAQLTIGKATLEVMHTPGHTLESIALRLDDEVVFTGDTLFVDGVGRPDLKANQEEAVVKSKLLYHSLHRLMRLNPKTRVLPAHHSTAIAFNSRLITETIGRLQTDLAMLALQEDEFVHYTTTRIPPTPPNYTTIASLNQLGALEGHSRADLEAGANRCAIA